MMSHHVLQLLLLRRELASSAETFCCFVELNVGMIERDDVAKIYKMIGAELNLIEYVAYFKAG